MSRDNFESTGSAKNVLSMADFVSDFRPTAEQLAAAKARHPGFLNRQPQAPAITLPIVENLNPDNIVNLASYRELSTIDQVDPDNVF